MPSIQADAGGETPSVRGDLLPHALTEVFREQALIWLYSVGTDASGSPPISFSVGTDEG